MLMMMCPERQAKKAKTDRNENSGDYSEPKSLLLLPRAKSVWCVSWSYFFCCCFFTVSVCVSSVHAVFFCYLDRPVLVVPEGERHGKKESGMAYKDADHHSSPSVVCPSVSCNCSGTVCINR